jgi:xanthine dehydrogenase YagR molybdenum-binding subunit
MIAFQDPKQAQPKPAPKTTPRQLPYRYDALAKVTGRAKYSAEFSQPFPKDDLVYAFIVQSTIANGSIASIDRTAAERAPGVLAVLTPFNAPKVSVPPPQPVGARGQPRSLQRPAHRGRRGEDAARGSPRRQPAED